MCVYLDVSINLLFVCTPLSPLSSPTSVWGDPYMNSQHPFHSIDVTSVSTPGAALAEDVWYCVIMYVDPPHTPLYSLQPSSRARPGDKLLWTL